MGTPKELSSEISKRAEKELEKFKEYYKSADENEVNSEKYCNWLHDILSFQVNEKNFDVSSLKSFIDSVIDFQKDRYEDRHQAWRVDLCFQEPSSAGYGDFIIHVKGIDSNFNDFIFKTSVDLFNSGKGSIEDLRVFFGLFICTNFMEPTQRLDDLNAFDRVEYGPFDISNPRPMISSKYNFCRRGYEDHVYLNFNCFDENSLNTLYGL